MKKIRDKSNKKLGASTDDIYHKIRGKIESYLDSKCVEEENYDPLDYWSMAFRTNQPMEVKLSQIAVHYLTPPASSVDIERLFSTAADIITDDRGGIDPYKAEKILFCHENLPLIGYKYD